MSYHTGRSPPAEDDSPWMSDDESMAVDSEAGPSHDAQLASQSAVSQQEWDKLSLRFSDEGYRQGITAGKESKLQPGFDQGFAISSPIARQLGILRALAASLLSLLTTAAAAKHATKISTIPPPDSPERTQLVAQLREVVTALGRLDELGCLPVDREAEEHAREHEKGTAGGQWDGTSQAKADKDEMRDLELMMSGTVKEETSPNTPGRGLEEARVRLAALLDQCGMGGLVPPPLTLAA